MLQTRVDTTRAFLVFLRLSCAYTSTCGPVEVSGTRLHSQSCNINETIDWVESLHSESSIGKVYIFPARTELLSANRKVRSLRASPDEVSSPVESGISEDLFGEILGDHLKKIKAMVHAKTNRFSLDGDPTDLDPNLAVIRWNGLLKISGPTIGLSKWHTTFLMGKTEGDGFDADAGFNVVADLIFQSKKLWHESVVKSTDEAFLSVLGNDGVFANPESKIRLVDPGNLVSILFAHDAAMECLSWDPISVDNAIAALRIFQQHHIGTLEWASEWAMQQHDVLSNLIERYSLGCRLSDRAFRLEASRHTEKRDLFQRNDDESEFDNALEYYEWSSSHVIDIDPRKKGNLKQTIIDHRIKMSFGRAISRDLCEEERTRSATRPAVLLTSYIGEEENNHSVEIHKRFLDMVMVYFHPRSQDDSSSLKCWDLKVYHHLQALNARIRVKVYHHHVEKPFVNFDRMIVFFLTDVGG
ncbi:hypothetical protein IV203_000188 [Nitzschia inconspicua]|uniref:Uncharacterized protein n=1 Tax=Nitzschia inconspicua TaxID=303405 RepID=A0A9K3L4U0_9STRA|nr:hypothetical protein IV203_000188 [Nitzschia inconspicua]